jgi:phosphatidylserine/phosphatidylglycerophosphate/cardiolipin synthase-like enzyme
MVENQTQEVLADKVQRLVDELAPEFTSALVKCLLIPPQTGHAYQVSRVIESIPSSEAQFKVRDLLNFWQKHFPEIPLSSLGFALLTAAKASSYYRDQQKLDLVWTGPSSPMIPMRRTDQALLELIESARSNLLIVSFAVYKIQHIVKALNESAQKGISIDICLETPDASEGRIAYDTLRSLGDELAKRAHIYIWPLEQRLVNESGRHGSLHAKVAVADGEKLFISSANLTDYAMNLNMEMGVLVEGGRLPDQVRRHFLSLITDGHLRRVE